ncbi:MAG: hypothetical protein KJ697_03910 [Nanoarchaeota archaeon]|nr:hypothetical protein [Nanoarchaeota archaeon]MBU4072432.1 hypothetical protein [Candidatus Thermoplasmatota archaeon]
MIGDLLKNLLIPIMALLLVTSVFAAQGDANGLMGNNSGNDTPVMAQTMTQSGAMVQAQNATQLREMVQNREQEMIQAMESMSLAEKNVYQNQNQVRLAVHTLLSMEDMIGGIGPQVSAIAKQFNNSVQNTVRAEEKIQTKNGLMKFFFGGDSDAATEIETEVVQNQNRVQELNQLRVQCNCSEEVKSMFQEQIQHMEQEQTRLQQLAQSEKQSKGIFGWLFK